MIKSIANTEIVAPLFGIIINDALSLCAVHNHTASRGCDWQQSVYTTPPQGETCAALVLQQLWRHYITGDGNFSASESSYGTILVYEVLE